MTTISLVHIERTGTHQKNVLFPAAKHLRAAQNASHEFIGRSKSEAESIPWIASWIFQQEPPQMPFDRFRGTAGLNRDETCNLGQVPLMKEGQCCRPVLRNHMSCAHDTAS